VKPIPGGCGQNLLFCIGRRLGAAAPKE